MSHVSIVVSTLYITQDIVAYFPQVICLYGIQQTRG